MWHRNLQADYLKEKEEAVWLFSIGSVMQRQLCSSLIGQKEPEIMKLEWVEKLSQICLYSFFLVPQLYPFLSQLYIKILPKWGSEVIRSQHL